MRLTTLLLIVAAAANAQVIRFYKPGQTIPVHENSGLVLKHDGKSVKKLGELKRYSEIKTIKFLGFNSPETQLDSALRSVARQMQPHTIIFEDCDLNEINTFLDIFPQLTTVSITKHSSYFENSLLTYLGRNQLRKLAVQADDEEFITDSLHLLKELEVLDISSNHIFNKPNRTDKFQVSANGVTRTVLINYYGSFYRNYKEPLVRPAENKPEIVTASKMPLAPPINYACLKQPLPGVNINDTVYNLVAQDGGKFYYESGSEIEFEKDAFLNADGSSYQGAVGIFYREFRNPVEIMLSGIPMVVKEGGENKIFKSGGMYEINAVDANGNQLRTRSENSIKINFALTDTSSEFKFYSLNDSGSWNVTSDTVVSAPRNTNATAAVQRTKAIDEYIGHLYKRRRSLEDTTPFVDRFESAKYLYTYRKDNMKHWKDTMKYDYFGSSVKKNKGIFRIKYVTRTKDKQIIFTLVPVSRSYYHDIPKHVRYLTNRYFIYTGELDRQQFKEKFCKNIGYWDLRTEASGNEISFQLKTYNDFVHISGQPIVLYENGKYAKQETKPLQVRIDRTLAHEAKIFRRKLNSPRQKNQHNSLAPVRPSPEQAWVYSKKFQNEKESAMDFKRWQIYVQSFIPRMTDWEQMQNNTVGTALVQSGLGIKNIDVYIHNSQMEPVFVEYNNAVKDSTGTEYHAMLYKTINTSYPLVAASDSKLQGYYFKHKPNYIIRFSGNGYMQVTKPEEAKSGKRGDKIVLDFNEGFFVKDMNSSEITKLILN